MFVCKDKCAPKHLSKEGIAHYSWRGSFGRCEMCEKPNKECMDVPSGADWAWQVKIRNG